MEPTLKRKLAIGAGGLALLAGAGGTYAATRGSDENDRQAFLNDAARRLDVSPRELSEALRGAFFDRLDAAVADGRITRAEADEIKRRIRQRGGAPPFFGGPPRLFHRGPGGPFRTGIDAAAKYLDLSHIQLRERLESGKSLAQVARDRDKSVDGLEEAIKDAIRKKLDAAVADKRLTKAQEREILSGLDSRIHDLVQRSGRRSRGRNHPHPHLSPRPGFGGPPGF